MYDGPLKKQGLEIIAYPSNQFGGQEPGSAGEIKSFQKNYGVNFPVMAKSDVKGGDANDAYQYLTGNKNGGGIPWNFTKFLVNKDGDVVGYYGPQTSPSSIVGDIETLIAQSWSNWRSLHQSLQVSNLLMKKKEKWLKFSKRLRDLW